MKRSSFTGIALAALPLLWALAAPVAFAQGPYTFTNIDFPTAGVTQTVPTGINDSGQIVGSFTVDSGVTSGFLFSGGVYTLISYPGAGQTMPSGINASGQIVGSFTTVTGCGNCYGHKYPFLLSGGVYTALPEAPGSIPGTTQARAINSSGQIVGGYPDINLNLTHGFLFSGGAFTTIDDPSFSSNAASGINDSGQIVGFGQPFWGAQTADGFLLSGGVFTAIDDPVVPLGNTQAEGINSSGQVVGNLNGNGSFLFSGGTYTTIAVPNGAPNSTQVLGQAINSIAQIVGAYTDSSGLIHGFLATPGYLPTYSVSAKMDIYRAGGYSDGSGGSAPAAYTIQPGTAQTVTFSGITGTWTCNSTATPYGPDGATSGSCAGGLHINNPIGPFSGWDTTDFSGGLVGVFLADSLPPSPPPPLRFYLSDSSKGGIQTNFTSLSPLPGQVFFIGDGLTETGAGSPQVFYVPPTATHLYLGYVDSCNGTSNKPSCYSDNSGSVTPTFSSSCGFSISPTSQSFGASGGSGQTVVTTILPPASCPFSATSNASWMIVAAHLCPIACTSAGCPCVPSPQVGYTVAPNSEPSQRIGTLTIAGQTLTVTQSGAGTCAYSIKPTGQTFSENGGKGTVAVTTQTGCSWSAVSGANWVTIPSGSSSGSGSGSVSFNVATNTGVPRTGTLTIAGQTYTVTQSASGCGATDVSNLVSVSQNAFMPWPPLFEFYIQTVSLSNRSAQTIPGPIYLVMDGLPRTGGTCVATGVTNPICNVSPAPPVTLCQSPGGSDLYQVSSGPMAPNHTITVTLSFLPGQAAGGTQRGLDYTTRVFSGTPTQ
jgi:probable HAF family extracellular repeat protein